jgi:hypothetical protein
MNYIYSYITLHIDNGQYVVVGFYRFATTLVLLFEGQTIARFYIPCSENIYIHIN